MSIYKKMKGGSSYGVVPGNGNPKADDKLMIAGAGHVIPAENAHIAKKIVGALGYDPNAKVDMNQAAKTPGPSVAIKISSKEYFMNDDQVNEMKEKIGIDPEMLSPNSDYNQRVNGGTTKQVDEMVDKKLFGMMAGGRPLAYQDGGANMAPSPEGPNPEKSQVGYRAPLDGSTQPPDRQAGVALLKNKYGDTNWFAKNYNATRELMEESYNESPYYSDAEGNQVQKNIDPDVAFQGQNLYVSMRDSAKHARALNQQNRQQGLGYQKIQRDAFYDPTGSKESHVAHFQDGGGIPVQDGEDPQGPPMNGFPAQFRNQLHRSVYGDNPTDESRKWVNQKAAEEWPKYMAGNSYYQYLEMDPEVMNQWMPTQAATTNPNGVNPDEEIPNLQPKPAFASTGAPSLNIPSGSNQNQTSAIAQPSQSVPAQGEGQISTPGQAAQPGATTPAAPMSPEDKHVHDLIKKSKDMENQEVAANAAMGLWNMSRERQPMPEPVYMSASFIRRDYESMKNDMSSDIERAERRGTYQAKQLGMSPTANVGMVANSQEAVRKGNRSIWDMQQQDMAHNVGIENQAKSTYQGLKLQRDMADSQAAQNFSQQKGQAMADNTREIFGAKEAGLYRTGELEGVAVNRSMDQLDKDYTSLNKDKMLRSNVGYISRDKYYKMSDQERKELHEKLK